MINPGDLKNKIDVYNKVRTTNSLNETEYNYKKIKSVWSMITPSGGNLQRGEVNTTYANISHKITVRYGAIPDLNNEMYFVYKGQRYDVEYFIPNYKYKDRIEIFCNLVVE